MHDCKGRLIEKGDVLAVKDCYNPGKRAAVKVVGCIPGASSCNVYGQGFFDAAFPYPQLFTASETELILKADGSNPPDPAEAAVLAGATRAMTDG